MYCCYAVFVKKTGATATSDKKTFISNLQIDTRYNYKLVIYYVYTKKLLVYELLKNVSRN